MFNIILDLLNIIEKYSKYMYFDSCMLQDPKIKI